MADKAFQRLMLGLCLSAGSSALLAAPARSTEVEEPANVSQSSTPRLAVLVHVDGFRADYLERFAPLLGQKGLSRIQSEGAVFDKAAVTHTVATLAPGITSLATGLAPGRAGIPNDQWFDRRTREHQDAAEDRHASIVSEDIDVAKDHLSPANLQRATLGDLMQAQLGEESLVFGFSW
ncbi:MAG: hypothetical protein ACI9EF_002053, partial [Pseudohongiellaceae bacterium]